MKTNIHQKLLNAVTTGTGTGVQFNGAMRDANIYIIGTGTVAGGAVQLEHSHDKDYAGTWVPIGAAITVVGDDTVLAQQVSGAYGAVRARVSTDITGGGTVTVEIFGNSEG